MKKRKVQVVIFARKNDSSPANKILLLQTNKRRGGFWQNVTGSVEKGERYKQAALRELNEETGIELNEIEKFIDLQLEHSFLTKKGHSVTEKSFAVIVAYKKVTLDPNEHQKSKWQNLSQISLRSYGFPTNFESFFRAKKLLKQLE